MSSFTYFLVQGTCPTKLRLNLRKQPVTQLYFLDIHLCYIAFTISHPSYLLLVYIFELYLVGIFPSLVFRTTISNWLSLVSSLRNCLTLFSIEPLSPPAMGDLKDGDANEIWEMSEQNCYVGLTHDFLNIQEAIDKVRSPMAGAIVLFAGWLQDILISDNIRSK